MAVLPKPRIEAIQSVPPFKMTDPRVTRRVDPCPLGSFRRCFNTVLYFKRADGDSFSGWEAAGWIKDSLGKAFVKEPLLCGRLRRSEVDGGFEVASNDSGARLIEARIGIRLDEFVGAEGREEAEAELVYWKDIDEENPQFCPLFYIQVTNFECGGYSIGINCSLLLGDPSFIISFLKKWATIQSKLVSLMSPTAKKPIFYLHSIRSNDSSSPSTLSPSPCKKSVQTIAFKADCRTGESDAKSLALLCVEYAQKATSLELGSEVSLLVRDRLGELKVETFMKSAGLNEPRLGPRGLPTQVSWESFGIGEVAFWKGRLPALVSHWVGSPDGFVMVAADGKDNEHGAYVFVTI